jgi:hypothetical protein
MKMNIGKIMDRISSGKCSWLFLSAVGIAHAQIDTPYVSLFNGTDLTGWSSKSAATDIKNFASVKDGYILLDSPGGAGWLWLYSEKEYTDFVFKTKFSAPTGDLGNSGVNFRSLWDPNDAGGYLNGPQVDIFTASANTWRTGLILDMTKGNERWLFPDLPNWTIPRREPPAGWSIKYFPEWNDLEIRVVGNQVTSIVNGIKQADWNGTSVLTGALHTTKNVGRKGYLALQAHSGERVLIYFKDIKIADLSAATAIRAPHGTHMVSAAHGPGPGEQLHGLDGRRLGNSAQGEHGLRTGLYVVKGSDGPRLRAMAH